MKPWVNTLLGFAGGVAVGCVATYFGMKAKFEKHSNDIIREYREYSNERIQKAQDEVNKLIAQDKFDEEEYNKKVASEPEFEDYTAYARQEDHNGAQTAVNGVSEPLRGISVESARTIKDEMDALSRDVHDQDFDEHMAEREAPEDDEPETLSDYEEAIEFNQQMQDQAASEGFSDFPRTISAGEMLNSKQWYSKLTFTYYAADEILADDQDMIVDDYKDIVGEHFADLFGTNEDDPDVVYIRNDERETDYEVIMVKESYKDRYPNESVSISD